MKIPSDQCYALTDIVIREIRQEDNQKIAAIIRRTMEEFKINKPHTIYYEATTDTLYELFGSTEGSRYLVAELDSELVGGAGIFPTDQLPEGLCEFVKFYVKSSARGKGIGKALISRCLQFAREFGYTQMYLESSSELETAIKLYEYFNFKYLNSQIGNSGHDTDTWMIRDL
jgi:putative acetyltransferase